MSHEDKKIIVYVDTSYLNRIPTTQIPEWQKLLLHAKNCKDNLDTKPRLEIHISHIVAEEYRTQSRDELQASIEETYSNINNLTKTWNGNPIGKKIQPPNLAEIFPSHDKIEDESHKIIEELKENGAIVIDIEPGHGKIVWENYFAWQPPFDGVSYKDRNDEKRREKRRTHIPDAWIYIAALDTQNEKVRLLCLCKDKNLANALKAQNLEVFSDAAEILKLLDTTPKNPTPITPAAPAITESSYVTATGIQPVSEVDTSLAKIENDDKQLRIRILGYVQWFAPISKSDLSNLLINKGHAIQIINNTAERLALNGLITDTGNNYIPANKAVCNQAANLIMNEILEILDK